MQSPSGPDARTVSSRWWRDTVPCTKPSRPRETNADANMSHHARSRCHDRASPLLHARLPASAPPRRSTRASEACTSVRSTAVDAAVSTRRRHHRDALLDVQLGWWWCRHRNGFPSAPACRGIEASGFGVQAARAAGLVREAPLRFTRGKLLICEPNLTMEPTSTPRSRTDPRSHARSSYQIKAPTDHPIRHQPPADLAADILLVPHGTGSRPSTKYRTVTRTTEIIAEIQYLGHYLGEFRRSTRVARCNRDRSGAQYKVCPYSIERC